MIEYMHILGVFPSEERKYFPFHLSFPEPLEHPPNMSVSYHLMAKKRTVRNGFTSCIVPLPIHSKPLASPLIAHDFPAPGFSRGLGQ